MSQFKLSYRFCIYILILTITGLKSSPTSAQTDPAPPGKVIIQEAPKTEGKNSKDSSSKETEEKPSSESSENNGLDLEKIKAQLKTVEESDVPEEQKKKLTDPLKAAVSYLEEAEDKQAQTQALKVDPQTIEQDVAAAKDALAAEPPKLTEFLQEYQVPKNASLETIESTLSSARQKLSELEQAILEKENALKTKEANIKLREDRVQKNPTDMASTNKRLEEIPKLIEQTASAETSEQIIYAEKTRLQAEQQKLFEQRKYLSQEIPAYSARKELRNLERQVLQKEIKELKQKAEALQGQINNLSNDETDAKLDELEKLIKYTSEPLKPLAREIAELTRSRQKPEGKFAQDLIQITQSSEQLEGPLVLIGPIQSKLKEDQDFLNFLESEKNATQDRLTENTRPETFASTIEEQRGLIPSIYEYEDSEIRHQRRTIDYRSVMNILAKQEDELVDLDDEIEELLPGTDSNKGESNPLEQEARDLLLKKQAALATLKNDYQKLWTATNSLAKTEGDLVVLIREYTEYLDQQSLWIPVAEVLQLRDLKNAPQALEPLVNVENWMLLGETIGQEVMGNPAWTAVIVILLIIYIPLQSRMKRRVSSLSKEFSDNFLAPFSITREAFFITVLLPLWIPALVWLVGSRLLRVLPKTDLPNADVAFVPAFGAALISMSFVLCVLRLARYLVKSNGLGEVHFRWPKQQLLRVRLNQHWYTVCAVPLVFVITLIHEVGDRDDRRSLGRLLMLALMLLTAWFLYRVLSPAKSSDERSSQRQLSLWRKILIFGPPCVPLFFALLSVSGYTFTANILMARMIFSAGVLLLLKMTHELCYRWVYIARGKLALEQAKQRQEAREAEEARKAEGETSESPQIFDPKSASVDLSAINAQTRQLLSTSFGLAVFISVWMIWSDVTPEIGILNYPLVGAEFVEQLVSEEEGAETVTTLSTENAVTVKDLLLFILTFVVTIIASKNLPGLLEITVLQNLPLDTGIRYAVGAIARYILMAVGIAVGCGILGIGMTQISILLGGLAVGLGFGLQEMFANFVSGIILLFEQPLRVGDIVTIGGVTGSVTRIRIRATTITDWDRKEHIIPNKEFIVGQFDNWTLTDTINRVVILVGVAYGGDTEKARELLLKICADHPEVMDEPTASAVFDAFGDSTLNITLRCYLPRLDNRLQTIHELHTAIDREFKKAKIEIAFPQMDLHLRSIDRITNPLPLSQQTSEQAENPS